MLDGVKSGLEVIKLEFILKLKIIAMINCVRKQPIIAPYFEFDTVLKFYNLGACAIVGRLFHKFWFKLHLDRELKCFITL